MTARRFDLLRTPGFLSALALLVINDVWLKAAFGNWFTGKLSDVAGVAAFALFLTACVPARRTRWHVATAIAFVFWKLPASDPLTAFWSEHLWAIGRVADATDLIALAILPVSWHYASVAAPMASLQRMRPAVAVMSIVAFSATSRPYESVEDNGSFAMPFSRESLPQALAWADSADSTWSHTYKRGRDHDVVEFWFRNSDIAAQGEIVGDAVLPTALHLHTLKSRDDARHIKPLAHRTMQRIIESLRLGKVLPPRREEGCTGYRFGNCGFAPRR
jgi:hypothetical protein